MTDGVVRPRVRFNIEDMLTVNEAAHARGVTRAAIWNLIRRNRLRATDLECLPRCRALPAVASFGHLLGVLYVLEGATLGAQLLARHFKATLDLTAANGAAFFAGYGAETGARWKEFGAFAEACATTEVIEAAAVTAAQETFTKLEQWLTN